MRFSSPKQNSRNLFYPFSSMLTPQRFLQHTYFSFLALFVALCMVLHGHQALAQVIQITPPFPTMEDTVTVVFDATLGTGGLKDVVPVYAHTGVITDKSSSPSDWKYVVAAWGTDNPKVKMTALGDNLHSLRFHIRSFYGVPQGESVKQLAFVFRNANGSKEGKDAGGKDIFYTVYDTGSLLARFIIPMANGSYQAGDTVRVRAASSAAATLTVLDGTQQLTQTVGKELNYNYVIPAGTGTRQLKLTAVQGTQTAQDSVSFSVRGQTPVAAVPAGVNDDGITYLNDSTVVLKLYAPGKRYIYALGDFNNWQTSDSALMNKTPDGNRFWIQLKGLTPGKEYGFQYLIDGNIRLTDAYADKILHPTDDPRIIAENRYPNLMAYPRGKTTGIVGIFQPGRKPYVWKAQNFKRPAKTDLIIYELLLRDFTTRKTFKAAMDSLQYLKALGVNCIELMPVMEFGGNESWGYNPEFFCAVDKFYGTENDLRQFIDSAHTLGMAVVLDIVLNHATGECPLYQLYPASNNPYFNLVATHPFNVFNDFNHEFSGTQYFVDRVVTHWLQNYRADGFRFDLSKGMTQFNSGNDVALWGRRDTSRIKLLKRMANTIWGADNSAYIILEHFADNDEEKELADYGMMLWGNLNYNYNEATMGWHTNPAQSDFSWIWHGKRGWKFPHAVGYMESHDEERLMFRNLLYGNTAITGSSGAYNLKDTTTALNRMKLAAAFFFTIPGPKMLWQFGEFGYDYSINYPSGSNNDRLTSKPVRWDYLADPRRKALFGVYSELARLKTTQPVFTSTTVTLSLSGALKRINLSSAEQNVTILGNFGVEASAITPNFQHTGTWYDFFSGSSLAVTDPSAPVLLNPGQFFIYSSAPFPAPQRGLVTAVADRHVATESLAMHVSPNPSAEFVEFRYDLPKDAFVTLTLHNVLGEHVATIVSERQTVGRHSIVWSSKNTVGTDFPEGVYLYRLSSDGAVQSGTLLVVR